MSIVECMIGGTGCNLVGNTDDPNYCSCKADVESKPELARIDVIDADTVVVVVVADAGIAQHIDIVGQVEPY